MKFQCDHCGKIVNKKTGALNRSRKQGLNIYCNHVCSGLGRRKNITLTEVKEKKRLYDKEYRKKNAEILKVKKSKYHQCTYDSKTEAIKRAYKKREKPQYEEARRKHMASSRYKYLKKKYDRHYRAIKVYGKELGECMALSLDIRDECLNQMSDYEIRVQAGTINKCQKRRKDYERLNSNKSEIGALGNAS